MLDDYEELSDPGDAWEPSNKEVRRQRDYERIHHHAQRVAAEAPPLSEATIARVAALLSHRTRPSELMRWRLRLFCGHVTERSAHRTHKTVRAAFMAGMRCDECGLDPATIVAAKPIGLVEEPTPTKRHPRRIDQEIRRREREIERHKQEIDRLRVESNEQK